MSKAGFEVTSAELVERLRRMGTVLTLDAEGRIRFKAPESAAHLIAELAQHKSEVASVLKLYGGRIATFPHCPRCASYALYRKDDQGAYECGTCDLVNIDEATARRTN